MVTVEQVKAWVLDWHKIGHAVADERAGWVWTACQTVMTSGVATAERPRRICRKCRERLKVGTLVGA